MLSIRDLGHGIIDEPGKLMTDSFKCFSMMYTVIKIATQFFPKVKIEGLAPLIVLAALALVYGLWKVWKPSQISLSVAHCNTCIEVLFGDIFDQDGLRAIAVNEFFDTELGKPVSPKSLHGVFIEKCFGGRPESLDALLRIDLATVESHANQAKIAGKMECYPIGTTALVPVNEDRYILFAFAKTEVGTCKAYSNVEYMSKSLHKLWERARIESGGYPVNIPLVGSGLSGMGLPTRDLLNLIVLSAITETKTREITQVIRVVLHPSRFKDIDLRDFKARWGKDKD